MSKTIGNIYPVYIYIYIQKTMGKTMEIFDNFSSPKNIS